MANVRTEGTDKTLEYWANRPYLSDTVRQSLAQANVLVVPSEGFRDQEIQVFPVCTEGFYEVLRDELPPGTRLEIAINDSDYKELALHSATLIIASVVVGTTTLLILPVVVNIVSEYINRRLFNEKDRKESIVRWELTVVDGTRATKLTYEGPVTDFKDEMQRTVAEFSATVAPPASESPLLLAPPLMNEAKLNGENNK